MRQVYRDSAIGSQTKFIEVDGELPRKQIGNTIYGYLVMETDDNGQYRLYFEDPKVMAASNSGGVFRGLLSFGKTSPDPIRFEFSQKEMAAKTKRFSYWSANNGFAEMYVVECYDMTTHRGCWYRFDDQKTAEKWAHRIGIEKRRVYDEDGNVESETAY